MIWGVFLVVLGALLVVFNKPYTEKVAPLVRVRLALADRPRLTVVLLGLAIMAAGISAIVSIR